MLVKRAGAGYDGTTDDYIDISIYDNPAPLKELERLYKLHKLYFFRSDPKNLIDINESTCKDQTILKDKAYKGQEFYTGPVNGVFDEASHKALNDFMGWENYDVRIRQDNKIDTEVLDDVRKNYSEWKAKHK